MATKTAIETSTQKNSHNHDACLTSIANDKDKDAFRIIFDYFAPRIKSFLMRGGFNEQKSEELTQEVMITVWHKASQFSPEKASASTWIFTIARNKKIDHIRKQKRHEIDPNDPCFVEVNVAQAKMPDETIIEQSEAKTIKDAIETLPKEQAELINVFYFDGKTHNEIADEYGLPLGTVKSRIRLAFDKLKRNLMI